jgi:ABC-2 type transport system permease protein
MRIFDLAFKDLSQIVREKRSLLFLVAMPVLFTLFMGFAFKGAVQTPDPRLPLGFLNQDPQGAISQQLHQSFLNSDSIRLVDIQSSELDASSQKINKGELAGVLVIPENYSQKIFAGEKIQLVLVADELSTTGQSLFELVRVPITRLMGSVEISRLALPANSTVPSNEERTNLFQSAYAAWNKAVESGASIVVEKAIGKNKATDAYAGNAYNQTSPGILLQFAIFGLVTSANILVQERKTHTYQRLITTSMKPTAIIGGHVFAYFLLAFSQQVILVLFGQFFLKVNYFREPLAILLVMITLSLWVSCIGLLISVVARNEQQVVLFSLICMFAFSGLGGAWFPLEGSGPTFATIGHFTPGAWAMDGFQNILIRGQGLSSALLPSGILILYAVIFFAIAIWRFSANRESNT